MARQMLLQKAFRPEESYSGYAKTGVYYNKEKNYVHVGKYFSAGNYGSVCYQYDGPTKTFTEVSYNSGYPYYTGRLFASFGEYFVEVDQNTATSGGAAPILRLFKYGTGELTPLSTYTNPQSIYCICFDSSGYLHVCSTSNIRAFSIVGEVLTYVSVVTVPNSTTIAGITFTGNRLVVSSQQNYGKPSISGWHFNGNSYISKGSYLVSTASDDAMSHSVIVGQGNTIVWVTTNDGSSNTHLKKIDYDGETFNTESLLSVPVTNGRDLEYDGTYYYVWRSNGIISVYGNSFQLVSFLVPDVTSSQNGTDNIISSGGGYLFQAHGTEVYVSRMTLMSQFEMDKVAGVAPLTINFTAV